MSSVTSTIGLITPERVAAALNCCPDRGREGVLVEMVDEANGVMVKPSETRESEWYKSHYETAQEMYEFLYAGTNMVKRTGMYRRDDMGAMPDAEVGASGLVKVHCVWGERNNAQVKFVSIHDDEMRHHYHAIQLQLHVTYKDWCDYFQWTEHGHLCERVKKDLGWYKTYAGELAFFIGQYAGRLDKSAAGSVSERTAHSARWAALAEDYLLSVRVERAAVTDKKASQELIKTIMLEQELGRCEGAGLRVQQVDREGTVDYKKMVYDLIENAEALEEQYRRDAGTSWVFKEVDGAE